MCEAWCVWGEAWGLLESVVCVGEAWCVWVRPGVWGEAWCVGIEHREQPHDCKAGGAWGWGIT